MEYISFNLKLNLISLQIVKQTIQEKEDPVRWWKVFTVLVSHVKAASYVLVIVSIYLASWTPFFAYSVYKSLTKIGLPTEIDGHVSDSTALNVTFLKSCIAGALQEKRTSIEAENSTEVNNFTKIILQSVEMKILSNIFGNYVSMLNSLANPVLYALWYPDFRKYALLVPHWIKMAFKKSEENVLVVNI